LIRNAALSIDLRSQLSRRAPFLLADFTLRLFFCRFHERNYELDWEQQNALETMRFQGLVDWLRGLATTDTDIR
jgi:hypothetical protein